MDIAVFEYRRLGAFTYHVLTDPPAIKRFLLQWIIPEWRTDHDQAPDEPWTVEWLARLPAMEFALAVVRVSDIRLRSDLMSHVTPASSFASDLERRADDREEGFLRGASVEPLLIDRGRMELMDGYTRYTVLRRHAQREAYAYMGGMTGGSSA